MARVDRVHVHAEWVRALVELNGVPPEKLVFSRIGLPFAPAPAPQRGPRRPGDPLRLVMVGRSERIKGQWVLIEAVKRLPPEVAVRVSFIGAPWDQSAYG